MNRELPQRDPLRMRHPGRPFRATTRPSAALLIRVAAGLDEWAECDRNRGPSKPE